MHLECESIAVTTHFQKLRTLKIVRYNLEKIKAL